MTVTEPGMPPRIARRTAAVRVFLALLATGVPIGALWAWLAPPARGIVALTRSGDRVRAYLGNDSDQLFLGAFLLVGFAGVVAVVAAVAVWQWRAHRGPVLLVALTTGTAGAVGVATGIGAVVVHWRYGSIDVNTAPVSETDRVHYVLEAPAVFFAHSPLVVAATFLLPAAVAAMTYALLAVSASRDDLGAWPPVRYAGIYPPVVPVSDPAPTAAAGEDAVRSAPSP
ncbi:DUF2567 domain-containing protein [Mycolicibacterium sp. 22603]|uniref:DUF2567 domain-containing protein n=1 Tax=Mycolicibacterium sp. 22603 TaxID=3453950 RepID=UPI003F8710C2